MDEWYLNDTRGLEHGFTLRAPLPSGIRLNVRGGLKARTSNEGVEFVEADGTARMKYTGLAAWDAAGKAVPARMEVQGGQVVLMVDDHGAKYPVTVDPIAQQAYLKASNTDPGDNFGFAVSVSGDTVVVGAPSESSATGVNGSQSNNNPSNSGADRRIQHHCQVRQCARHRTAGVLRY